jgi:hypothetical protein
MEAIVKKKNTIKDYIKEFKVGIVEGTAGLYKSGKAYVAAIDDDESNGAYFRTEIPGYSEAVWRMYEDIGRGLICLETIFSGVHIRKIRTLPVSEQKRIASGDKVELLLKTGDVLKVDPRTVTKDQAKRLYGKNSIRTVSEQKSWMADNPIEEIQAKVVKDPWTITNKGLRIGNIIITKTKLREILLQM